MAREKWACALDNLPASSAESPINHLFLTRYCLGKKQGKLFGGFADYQIGGDHLCL